MSLLLVGLLLSSAWTSGCRPSRSAGPPEFGDSSTDPPGSTASTGPWSTGYTAAALALELQGLPLDGFFAASWKALSLRDPETVVAYGLAEAYGLDAPVLTDISDAYVRDTYRMYDTVLEMLRQYDREALTPEEQISYDVYAWYLDDRTRQREFLYYDYPVTFFSTTAVHEQTMRFFTQLHPIRSRRDAEDYVARLGLVGAKFEQLLEGLKLGEKAGIVAPRFVVEWTLPGVEEMAGVEATASPYYRNLKEKLDALRGPTGAEKRALLEAAEETIRESILPAYRALAGHLRGLVGVAPTDDGVWRLPNGDAYYAYLLRHYTTTGLTAEEVHQLGLAELDRIHADMRAIFGALGYPENESLPQLFDRVAMDGGYVPGSKVIETYEGFIDEAGRRLDEAFAKDPRADVVVATSPGRGIYEAPAFDGSRPGTFWAGPADKPEELFAMRTLAYHETIPGHHLQIAYPLDSGLPFFRNLVSFDGYTEGWALYAERLAWELGWYASDPPPNPIPTPLTSCFPSPWTTSPAEPWI